MAWKDYEHECECGRRYRVQAHRIIMRDTDSIECECGRTIKEWNEAKIWTATLLPDKNKTKKNPK
jgi:hypothetical protein